MERGGLAETVATDVALLRAARRDPEAFGRFYRVHAEWAYRWLLLQVSDVTVATDLTAETFAQALVSLPGFRGEAPGSGTAWLFGIARNLVRDYFRARRVETRARERMAMPLRDYGPEESVAVEDRIDAAALAPELAAALDRLSPGLRRAFEMRVIDDMEYAELARAAGISEANARLRVSRATRVLRSRLRTRTGEAGR